MKRIFAAPLFVFALTAASLSFVDAETAQAQDAAATPQAAPADQTAALVNKVQAFYDKTASFQSDFTQEFVVKAYNQTKNSHGHVVFVKPGKMDWVYDEPQGNRVVSDGVNLWVYEANNKQVYQQTVNQSQYPAALSFLTGSGKLSDAFTFEMFSGDQMKFPGGNVLLGVPKSATPTYQKVLFYVDGPTSQVRRVMIIDGQGNRNRFDFAAPHVNEAVNPQRFQFTPPPGTTIIHP